MPGAGRTSQGPRSRRAPWDVVPCRPAPEPSTLVDGAPLTAGTPASDARDAPSSSSRTGTDDVTTSSTARWLYRFDQIDEAQAAMHGDWDRVRGLLGGKGANLGDMTRLGIPVPPGFTITTAACNAYAASGEFPPGLWDDVLAEMQTLESATGKGFGSSADPLLVACRSGAKFSMPGMMDTVLNIGLNDEVVAGMVKATEQERFVLDSYRRLIQMFGSVVLGIADDAFEHVLRSARATRTVASDSELTVDELATVIRSFKDLVEHHSGQPFPQDPLLQLRMSVEAVFQSWTGKRAHDYRVAAHIPHDLGTAVNVVAMVFGNMGEDSATGVAMSRDATTGEPRLEGDFLINAQGEDVVAGTRPTRPISELFDVMPEVAAQFADIAVRLERHYRDMQDMEFTVERGRLWLLQTRNGKRTAQAAVRIAVDQANEGLITREQAVLRVTPDQVDFFLHPQFDHDALANTPVLTYGLNVSPGAAVGVAAFDPDLAERWSHEGRDVVLVRQETKPDDVHGMLAAAGILTASGGRTSHAALVARQFGKPAVVGASAIDIDMSTHTFTVGNTVVHEGEWISVDGTTGRVFVGRIATHEPDIDNASLATILTWADEFRTLGVRANADDPTEAERARRYGATGIGLCRTEHMFFAPDRLPIMQRMITAETPAERREAIDALLPLQRNDFVGMLRAMAGLPVIIRLLDPPLHEFLPSFEELGRSAADLQIRLVHAQDLQTVEQLLDELTEVRAMSARVDRLRESNPMLGLRGVRLGLQIPELIRMQTRAIVEAAIEVRDDGIEVDPEIMIPLVSHSTEMEAARRIVESELAAICNEHATTIDVAIGTMIEVPRAALTAGEIAQHADFFSFGTNDLTQMTMGISRDDAEASFLLGYLADQVISDNPFRTIDSDGVGRLMEIATTDGRATRPDLAIGICGEHGGEPASIALCQELGIDYVSCSAYRVPVARLAAAHAALSG
ncbi:MAG: pyruvate, phosphate dikinase [Ilumatobacter sp.]|nr:pyruvate, phosphate dikinase [Ilumatobacter sp.]